MSKLETYTIPPFSYLRTVKKRLQAFLQRLLGFDNYLLWFSLFKIRTLRMDRKENDFFHFLGMIEPASTVLDIGANIGIMTAHLAKMPTRRVFAIEPVPANARALRRIVDRFKLTNVKILELALGDREGQVQMIMPRHSSVRMQGLSHVVQEASDEQGEVFTVPVKRLDDMPELQKVHISAIKMDVENFEAQVLEGGRGLISRCKPLVYCELWDNENRSRCFAIMRSLQYQIQVLENGKLVDFNGSQQTQNFFFKPL